ncbi:MAG: hypothetical protein L6R36_008675 [Xanthoria steineri]|nr:MAG: hypothetical protein L6R36_008675 [Xanthoria steineri]
MHEAVAAIASCGVSPLVRIGQTGLSILAVTTFGSCLTFQYDPNSTDEFQHAAHGVIVPLLSTVDDARSLVKAAKFPPAGQRGFGSPFAMEKFDGVTQTEYLQQANESLLTIVQIETQDALNNVEEIARVPGIDVLFCGPFDLGNNIGHPILDGTMHEELKEAVLKIQRVAKENRKASGIYATSGDQAREYADQGFQMISVATDAALLPAAMHSALTSARGSYVHSALNMAKGAIRGK